VTPPEAIPFVRSPEAKLPPHAAGTAIITANGAFRLQLVGLSRGDYRLSLNCITSEQEVCDVLRGLGAVYNGEAYWDVPQLFHADDSGRVAALVRPDPLPPRRYRVKLLIKDATGATVLYANDVEFTFKDSNALMDWLGRPVALWAAGVFGLAGLLSGLGWISNRGKLATAKTSYAAVDSELKRVQTALDGFRAASLEGETSHATLERQWEAARRECDRLTESASAREQEIASLERALKASRVETQQQRDLAVKLEQKWAAYVDHGGELRTFEKRGDGTWWLLFGSKEHLLKYNPEKLIKLIEDFQADLDPARQGYSSPEDAEKASKPIHRCLDEIAEVDSDFFAFLKARVVTGKHCYLGPPRQFKIKLPPRSPD
jgi:hypothetical protein